MTHLVRAPAELPASPRRASTVLLVGGGAALLWNLYGVVQFLNTLRSTRESLMAMGMSAHQASVYSSYPAWMTAAFGVGVFAGLLGSALLVLRRAAATPVLTASLAGYVVLFVGDVTEGVFAALGAPQVVVLSAVVAIATALLVWSRALERRGVLSKP